MAWNLKIEQERRGELANRIYLTLEQERESVIREAIEQIKMQSEEEVDEEELTELISEADHIHNKAIFDCVNEAMN
jgi:KaiC/GvpD/RAD55 family RecA-like ATPase